MFQRFLKRARDHSRYVNGPFAVERERYMEHLCSEGRTEGVLVEKNGLLLTIAERIDVLAGSSITREQVSAAADEWIRHRGETYRTPQHRENARMRFVSAGCGWLSFLGRLSVPRIEVPGANLLNSFSAYLQDECGFSPVTIQSRRDCLRPFFRWLAQRKRAVSLVNARDMSAYLSSGKFSSLRRTTISLHVQALRSFFRYAAGRGLCSAGIAECIDGPLLYAFEHLPQGPDWEDVKRLIGDANGDTPEDIRDRTILLLHAVYGFRVSEVRQLRLEDIDWQNELIRLRRPKHGRTQEYPLTQEVGEAMLSYLKNVRPRSSHREVFLSLTQPFRPLSRTGLASATRRRQKRLGLRLRKYGPHGLRHAVATHLISGGFSLKEVGDHLGHASTESTQIYAKVNLTALREVAALDLKEVVRHIERSERKSTPVYRRDDPVALREVARISLEGLS
jgi:integrase/recombinase XerD